LLEGGMQAEGRRWLETILSRIDEKAQPEVAGQAWLALAGLYYAQRLVGAARSAIRLFEQVGHLGRSAQSYLLLAHGLWQTGELADADAAIDRSLALYREAGLERTWAYANALNTKGNMLSKSDRLELASATLQDAIERSSAARDDHGVARTQVNLAELKFALEQPYEALRLAQEALATFRRLGAHARASTVAVNSAGYQLALGAIDDAEQSALAGLGLARETGQSLLATIAILHLARVANARKDAERAARLLGYVDEWCAREGFEHERGERIAREGLVSELGDALGNETVALLHAAGARLSDAEATVLAGGSY
jgi:tetratricopeptide (TPR) repeat protein